EEWGIEARLGGALARVFRAWGPRAADFELLSDPVRAILLRMPAVAWIWIADLTVVALRTRRLELEPTEHLLGSLEQLAAALDDTREGSPYRVPAKPRGGGDGA